MPGRPASSTPPKAAASLAAAGSGKDKLLKFLVLAALLALPLPALAETREERVAVAKDYVELALAGPATDWPVTVAVFETSACSMSAWLSG